MQDFEMETTTSTDARELTVMNRNLAHGPTDEPFIFDDPLQITLMGICLLVISLLGIIGNGLVAFAILSSRKLRSITNIFVMNLSVSDFIGCSMLPIFAVTYLVPDLQSRRLCAVAVYVAYIMFGASAVNIMLIACNRYCLIIYSKYYTKLYSKRNIIFMIIFSWVYASLVVGVPPFFGIGIMGYSTHYGTCGPIDFSAPSTRCYTLLRSTLGLAPFLIITGFCYLSIFRFVHNSIQNQKTHRKACGQGTSELMKRQIAVTKRLFIVVCAYIGLTAPYVIIYSIPALHPYRSWAGVCLAAGSCINPFIYGFWHPHFNETFKCIIKCQLNQMRQPSGLTKQAPSSSAQSKTTK